MRLERSNEELQQFAHVASHDLQEPLRMVISYLSLLEKKYHNNIDDQAQQYIEFAMDGGVRMRGLIEQPAGIFRGGNAGQGFPAGGHERFALQTMSVFKDRLTKY